MKRFVPLSIAMLLALPSPSSAQMFSVRRMAMGGAVLGGRQGGESDNVAYRAVPRAAGGPTTLSLPVGLVPVLANPPVFDPNDPRFNVFELANLIESPPWNLVIGGPATPSTDIRIDVARNSLTMDLGDMASVFPDGRVRAFGATNGPSMGLSLGRAFVAVAPLVEYQNDLDVGDALRGVLRHGEPLLPDQTYSATDRGHAQAAAALHLGLATRVLGGDGQGASALYAGARYKLLRGLAYGDADNVGSFTTGDTLFGSQPLDVHWTGNFLDATPAGGGWGAGLDAGAVWELGGLELGLAADDIGTRIRWHVRETVATRDSATGSVQTTTVADDLPFTSEVPTTLIANAAWRAGPWTLAADVRRNPIATTLHGGAERWLGPLALRGGASLDENQRVQGSGGVGVRLGHLGFDVALASDNRNLENRRQLELAAGLSLYH